MLLSNIIIPTRMTSYSATLIDYMYYHEGMKSNKSMIIESGSYLNDLSDHLPDYTILLNTGNKNRQLVRIMSQKNKEKFVNILSSSNWDTLFSSSDVNLAHNNFIETVTDAYELSFPLTRLSRKRSKDKVWITSALKKSSRTENSLYTKWLSTWLPSDEQAY